VKINSFHPYNSTLGFTKGVTAQFCWCKSQTITWQNDCDFCSRHLGSTTLQHISSHNTHSCVYYPNTSCDALSHLSLFKKLNGLGDSFFRQIILTK